MFDSISIPIAFVGGVVSFFAPCIVPLIPVYMSYVLGVSTKELNDKGYGSYVQKLILSSTLYILGFSLIFVILGSSAAGIGIILRRWDFLIQKLGGFLILIFGLEFAGIINIPFLARQFQIKTPNWIQNLGESKAFFLGMIFATTWTPCVGAILGSILALAAVSGTVGKGALLLFTYSLGISLPFIIVTMSLAYAPKYLKFISRHINLISKISGLALAAIGGLLITDTYKYLNAWIFEIAFKLGYQIR